MPTTVEYVSSTHDPKWRYQLICPALDPGLSTKARGRVVRAIAAKMHTGPFGGQVSYSRDHIDR